jgi:hypothetical protein
MIKSLPDREHLPMTSVHVNDVANPTEAIAISEPFTRVNPRSERKTDRLDEVGWFILSMSEAGWIVTDISISFELIGSTTATDDMLKKFLEANPKAINVSPQTGSETATSPADKTSAIPARVKYFTTGDGKKIACSPDGKRIAVASGGQALPEVEGWKRTVEILDAETGKTVVSISLTTQDEDAILASGFESLVFRSV